MAQLQITRFGGVDVLQLTEKELPAPAADQVLLEVLLASVNPIDAKTRAGLGWAAQKFKDALPWTPGFDVCGVVREAGSDVTTFSVGQRVCGIAQNVGKGGVDRGILGPLCDQMRAELRLPARSHHVHDAEAGDLKGDLVTEIHLDQRQSKVHS